MNKVEEQKLLHLAEAVVDRAAVDWDCGNGASEHFQGIARYLRLIDDIAHVHESQPGGPSLVRGPGRCTSGRWRS